MPSLKNLAYLLALHSIEGLGSGKLKKLLDHFHDPKKAWEAGGGQWQKSGLSIELHQRLNEARKSLDPDKCLQSLAEKGIKILTIFDADYPSPLKQLYDPPMILYYQGKIPANLEPSIAIVGARKITGYGKLVTDQFASRLSKAGLLIISGLARGVDTVAHQAALQAQGRTLAVLGGGLSLIYPPENTQLAAQISQGLGAVLSEFPPNYPPTAGNFPARNRIIAAFSQAVLVTEAAIDSGSLITAGLALELGKEVYAIPGPITSATSLGTAQLIKQGAKLVTTPDEILEDFDINPNAPAQVDLSKLDQTGQTIIQLLSAETRHIDEIARELHLSSAKVSSSLIQLELSGLIKNLGRGNYVKIV